MPAAALSKPPAAPGLPRVPARRDTVRSAIMRAGSPTVAEPQNRPPMDQRARQAEFEALLQPLLAGAFGTALHLTRHRDDAEDLVQEAAVQAFRAFHTFRSGTNFKAWFYRILTNLFFHRYRQRRREPQVTQLEDAPDLYLYTRTKQAGLHAISEDPATLIMSKLSAEQVAAAIDGLPEEYRMAASLYFMEEFAYQEIAEILDCPVGTVRSRLHRGRKLLQKALWTIAEEAGIVAELSPESGKE